MIFKVRAEHAYYECLATENNVWKTKYIGKVFLNIISGVLPA